MSELIRPGNYLAACTAAKICESGKGDAIKHYVSMTFDLLDDPYIGQQIEAQLWLTEKAQKRTVEQMRAAGFKGNDITDLSSLLYDNSQKRVEIAIDTDEFNGKKRSKVKWINTPRALRGDALQAFGARFNAKLEQFGSAPEGGDDAGDWS